MELRIKYRKNMDEHIHLPPVWMYKVINTLTPEMLAPEGVSFHTHTFPNPIWLCPLADISTIENPDIFYARRGRRLGLSKFVKGIEPLPDTRCTVVLLAIPDDPEYDYVVLTAYVGGKSEVEPWDPQANDAAKVFWANHALIDGHNDYIPATVTRETPDYFN